MGKGRHKPILRFNDPMPYRQTSSLRPTCGLGLFVLSYKRVVVTAKDWDLCLDLRSVACPSPLLIQIIIIIRRTKQEHTTYVSTERSSSRWTARMIKDWGWTLAARRAVNLHIRIIMRGMKSSCFAFLSLLLHLPVLIAVRGLFADAIGVLGSMKKVGRKYTRH